MCSPVLTLPVMTLLPQKRLEALRRDMPSDVDVSIDPAVSCKPGAAERLRHQSVQHWLSQNVLGMQCHQRCAPMRLLLVCRSWRGWTMRRCGICTRCGPTSSGQRQGAKTSQVRCRLACNVRRGISLGLQDVRRVASHPLHPLPLCNPRWTADMVAAKAAQQKRKAGEKAGGSSKKFKF